MDVKTLCLGVLSLGDATGYDIKKKFEQAFNHFFAAGYGSIYPALARLTDEGLASCTAEAQDGRPGRKVYSITAAGKIAFVRALMTTEPDQTVRSNFLVLTYFADLLSTPRLAEVLLGHLHNCQDFLSHLCDVDEAGLSPGVRFTVGYGKALHEAAIAYVETHGPALVRAAEAVERPDADGAHGATDEMSEDGRERPRAMSAE